MARFSCTLATVLVALVALVSSAPAKLPKGTFLEKDKLVIMETENAVQFTGKAVGATYGGSCKAGCWSFENTAKGYEGSFFRGEGYLKWLGNNYFGTTGKGLLEYNFYTTTPGVYVFGLHNFHEDPNGSESNDCFVKVDNQKNTAGLVWDKAFSNKVAVWTMDTIFHHHGGDPEYGAIKWDLAPGLHTLYISGRSHNFHIDRIHLHQYGMGATDPAYPESERVGYPYNPVFTAPAAPPPAPEVVPVEGKYGFTYEMGYDYFGGDLAFDKTAADYDGCALLCTQVEGCAS
jgi:hypothetical protein